MGIVKFNNDEKDNELQDNLIQLSQRHMKAEQMIDNVVNKNKNHPLADDTIKEILDNIFYTHFSYMLDNYFTDEKEETESGKIELNEEQQTALLKILLGEGITE